MFKFEETEELRTAVSHICATSHNSAECAKLFKGLIDKVDELEDKLANVKADKRTGPRSEKQKAYAECRSRIMKGAEFDSGEERNIGFALAVKRCNGKPKDDSIKDVLGKLDPKTGKPKYSKGIVDKVVQEHPEIWKS